MKCSRQACRNKIQDGAKQRRYCTNACSVAVRQERFWSQRVTLPKISDRPKKGDRP